MSAEKQACWAENIARGLKAMGAYFTIHTAVLIVGYCVGLTT